MINLFVRMWVVPPEMNKSSGSFMTVLKLATVIFVVIFVSSKADIYLSKIV